MFWYKFDYAGGWVIKNFSPGRFRETRLLSLALSISALKEAFFLSKINKNSVYDHINLNVVKKCFVEINKPVKHLFNLSLENGIFLEKWKWLKLLKVAPLLKNGDPENITNYCPM